MFCPFCGTVVEGGAQFCPNCGQQLPRSVDAGPIPTGGTIIDATVPDGTVVDGAMTGGTMPLGNQDFGTIPVQVPPVDSAPSAARPNKAGLDKGVWGIVQLLCQDKRLWDATEDFQDMLKKYIHERIEDLYWLAQDSHDEALFSQKMFALSCIRKDEHVKPGNTKRGLLKSLFSIWRKH